MSSPISPIVADGLVNPAKKSETERALERAADHRETPDGAEPESPAEELKRTADQNDRQGKR